MDLHWNVAGKLMQGANIPHERHVVLRENVATFLHHMPDEFVHKLDQGEVTLQSGFASCPKEWRWVRKASDDLGRPYTDTQVQERVVKLDAELKLVAAELMEHAGRKIYLTGSAVKGRLGGNSDLDCVAEGSRHPGPLVSVYSIGLKSFGTNVEVDPQEIMERDVVAELWKSGLEDRGYQVEDGQVTRMREVERRREPVVDEGFFIPIGQLP